MKLSTLAALALLSAAPAFAAGPVFTVDFEKTWDYTNGSVDGYYNGGTAADGSTGINLGVGFVGVSGLSNDVNFTYFTNAPSPQGVAYVYDTSAFINVAAGVAQYLSFSYASTSAVVGAIKAYAGLNGTGALLGSMDLAANNASGYDVWTARTFSFSGNAKSFDVGAAANAVAFDNVSSVPETSSLLMLLLGGAAVMGMAGRRRA